MEKQGCYKTGSRCNSKSSSCREGGDKTLLAWPGQPSAKEVSYPKQQQVLILRDLGMEPKVLAPSLVVQLMA